MKRSSRKGQDRALKTCFFEREHNFATYCRINRANTQWVPDLWVPDSLGTVSLERPDGSTTYNRPEIRKLVLTHFSDLYAATTREPRSRYTHPDEPEILQHEVEHAIVTSKTNISPGPDQITMLQLKLGNESIAPHLTVALNQVLTNKRTPEDWKTVLSPSQNHETEIPLVAVFLDFTFAFDNVNWMKISEVLNNLQIGRNVIRALNNSNFLVIGELNVLNKKMKFKIQRGVRQGDSSSPLLFALALQAILDELDPAPCQYSVGPGSLGPRLFGYDGSLGTATLWVPIWVRYIWVRLLFGYGYSLGTKFGYGFFGYDGSLGTVSLGTMDLWVRLLFGYHIWVRYLWVRYIWVRWIFGYDYSLDTKFEYGIFRFGRRKTEDGTKKNYGRRKTEDGITLISGTGVHFSPTISRLGGISADNHYDIRVQDVRKY
uniref:Reverse transcriptase domain-containing protein n=1 Tax=Caenorhabditis japonica TaxID=281687 RepID=A0A8R1EBG6_CAEJA